MVYLSKFPNLPTPNDLSIYNLIFDKKRTDELKDKKIFVNTENPEDCLSHSQAHELILKTGAALQKKFNLKKGDVISICSPNHVHYPIIMVGSQCAGGVGAAIDHASSPESIASDMNTISPKIVVAHPETLDRVLEAANIYNSTHSNSVDVLVFGSEDLEGALSVEKALFSGDELVEPYKFTCEEIANDPAYLYFTSGTTGAKKAVILTQFVLVRSLTLFDVLKFKMPNILAYTEFHHGTSLIIAMLQSLLAGYTVYIMPHYSFDKLCAAIEKYKAGMMVIQPYILSPLARDQATAKYDLSSLKSVMCCGAALSQDVAAAAKERLGLAVINIYGMTEVAGVFMGTPELTELGGVGYLCGGFSAKLVDEDGNEVPDGQAGELRVKGPTITPGYYKNPEATAAAFDAEGYFCTGDLFRCDENGCFYYIGRNKDLIKYGLEHIHPSEIESVLMSHPRVSDCAVIGVYSPELATELPRAYVSLTDGEKHNEEMAKEIKEYVDSRLPDKKQLRGGLVIVDSFPRTAIGKIQRRVLYEKEVKGLEF